MDNSTITFQNLIYSTFEYEVLLRKILFCVSVTKEDLKDCNGKQYNPYIGGKIMGQVLLNSPFPKSAQEKGTEDYALAYRMLKLISFLQDVGSFPSISDLCSNMGINIEEFEKIVNSTNISQNEMFNWWATYCDNCYNKNKLYANFNPNMYNIKVDTNNIVVNTELNFVQKAEIAAPELMKLIQGNISENNLIDYIDVKETKNENDS